MAPLHAVSTNLNSLKGNAKCTVDEHTVTERVHSPHVRRPIRMAQPPREWKQPAQHLRDLTIVDKWSESQCRHDSNTGAELDAIQDFDVEHRSRTKAIGSKQVNEVSWRQVQIDVLQAQQGCEEDPAGQ